MSIVVFIFVTVICRSLASLSVVPCGRMIGAASLAEIKMRRYYWRQPRIVGGTPVEKGRIPWQVAVRRDKQQVCGGAVISPNFVITTAHCFRQKGQYELSSGIIDVNDEGQLRSVNKTVVHPSWRYGVWENDIALLRVNEPFRFDALTAPLCLPSADSRQVGKITVSGWGRLREGHRQSKLLQEVALEVDSDEKCKKRFPYAFSGRTMFCASSENKDACQGDSGGAAFNTDQGFAVLIGLVSWGRGCARENTPGVYTKVTSFLPWIRETVAVHGDDADRIQLATELMAENSL